MSEPAAGKVVLVAGGGSGIGRAVVHAFAARGAHVIIDYFDSEEQAERTLDEVTSAGGSAELLRASTARSEDVEEMFAEVERRHGRLDVLVNNATYGVLGNLDDDDRIELGGEARESGLRGDVHGMRRWCAAAVGLLEGTGSGAIVNLTTPTRFALSDHVATAAGEAAQQVVARHLAAEFGQAGIRVNMVGAALAEDVEGMRPIEEAVADAVVFLASAEYVTGQHLIVGGGITVPSARRADTGERRPTIAVEPEPEAASDAGPSARVGEPAPAGAEHAIAVVGSGLVVPGANSPEDFWQILGQDQNTFGDPYDFDIANWFSPDPDAMDKSYIRRAGFHRDFHPHPELATEIAQGRWRGYDGSILFLRHCLLQARTGVATRTADRYGCYLGVWSGNRAIEEAVLAAFAAGHGVDRARLAEHYRHQPGRGRNCLPDRVLRAVFAELLPDDTDWLTVDTACSSSLYAIDLGVKSLIAGDCDIAYCGGGNGSNRRDLVLFSKIKGLSPSGQLRAFDADADGVLFSEGAAIVALKRLDRAMADGDEVLGVLSGFGGACDGQGSVLAPDLVGQRLSVQRARSVNDCDPDEIDWVVAHGTGTPVGDQIELSALAELAGERELLCTSNKPLVGHAGWAAGAVSVVHALEALRHERIPGERYFTCLPSDADIGTVRVPVEDTPWPRESDRPRAVGVSAFGLGGTNGHLLIKDAPAVPPMSNPIAAPPDLVLVGWQTYLPGSPSTDEVRDWVRTGKEVQVRSFGEEYPLPPVRQLRMPPVIARSIDRTQLMGVTVAENFIAEHGELWAEHRERTGVITGHMGPTRSLMEYTIRVAADDLTQLASSVNSGTPRALADGLAELSARLPAANDGAMPGHLANIIASRVVNRLHLNGLTVTVDAGRASTQAALHVAGRYLATGELDVALVLALNGNSTPTMAGLAELDPDQLAEGAVLLVVTRRGLAAEQGWPMLADVRTDAGGTKTPADVPRLSWGDRDEPSYLGADGALTVLRALESDYDEVEIAGPDPGPGVVVRPIPPMTEDVSESAMAQRFAVVNRRCNAESHGEPLSSIPEGGVVLVDSAELASALADRVEEMGALLLCTDPHAENPTDPDDPDLSARLDSAAPELRLVASAREESTSWPSAPPPALTRLQELTLVVCQRLGDRLAEGSVAAVLLDPLVGGSTHPHLTLITGFVRSLALELSCPVFAVVTDASLEAALDQLVVESSARRDRAVVTYERGLRYVERACPVPLPALRSDTQLCVADGAVVVATGGARGLTSVVLAALARRVRPNLWLLGTTAEGPLPDGFLDLEPTEFTGARRAFIACELAEENGAGVGELNRRFDGMLRMREIGRTLRRLRELCGPERVHYLVCDVADAEQVHMAARTIAAEVDRIDLLIHGAGRINSRTVDVKTLAEFRAVREPKVHGYHHLKEAFAALTPRLWCNFSSTSGFQGMAGDTDYSPANEYLAAAARYENVLSGTQEFSIAWGLWAETGMVSHVQKHLSRQYGITGMTNAEGASVFLRELASPRPPDAVSVYGLGTDEPGAGDASDSPDRSAVLIGEPTQRDEDGASWTWQARPGRDDYLREHLVEGRPTLPAVFMLTMAAEAAAQLSPGAAVTGFRGLRIAEPCYTDPDSSPVPCRVRAERRGPGVVHVTLSSDVVAPNGTVLRTGRVHCHTLVDVGTPIPAPRWKGGTGPRDARLIDDTATRPDTSVQLTGVWRTLTGMSVDGVGGTARWHPYLEPTSVFARLGIPALLIDSTWRTNVWDGPGRVRMGVPFGVDRIELFTTANDLELARGYPAGLHLDVESAEDMADEQYWAVAPNGDALLKITGLRYHVVASIPVKISYPEWRPSALVS